MIKTFKPLLLMLAVTLALASCKPESIKDYEPVELGSVKTIAGVWTGSSVTQIDNDAVRKNFPYKTMDVTGLLEFNKVKLTLQQNNGQPAGFTIDHGTAPPIFKLTSGTWKVDNTEKVGTVSLINGTDTVKMTMGSYNLFASNKMLLRQAKKNELGVDVITYEFYFSK
jgi:hypothetical protein